MHLLGIPHLINIHRIVLVDDNISQRSYFTPGDMRMLFAGLWRDMPCGFTNDLDPAEHSFLTLKVIFQLFLGFARYIVNGNSGRLQHIHQIRFIARHGSPAPNQGSVCSEDNSGFVPHPVC